MARTKRVGYTAKQMVAVRRGDIYCAPFCGRGCTHKQYLAAKGGAEKLVAQLGKGWKPRVWENMGWHYSAVSKDGRIKVHTHKYKGSPRDYTAFLGSADSPGGRWAEHGKTPKAALQAVLALALDEQQEVNALVASVKAVL